MTGEPDVPSRQRHAPVRHHPRRPGLLAVRPDHSEYRAGDGGRPRDCDQRHEHRRVDHGVVLGHLHRGCGRPRRSHRTGEDPQMGLCPEHRRLAAGRARAGGTLAAPLLMLGRICQGLSARIHHAREPRAHQDVLGRRRPATGHQPVVHGFVGRVGLCRALRRPDGRERRVALDLLRLGGRVRARHADGARHTGEQGRRCTGLPLRHHRCPHLHGDDGGIAGAGHSG